MCLYWWYCDGDTVIHNRPHWPSSLRRGSAAARSLEVRVWIPPRAWMFLVTDVCCQIEISATSWLLGQRSPTECGVSDFDREVSIMGRSRSTRGCCVIGGGCIYIYLVNARNIDHINFYKRFRLGIIFLGTCDVSCKLVQLCNYVGRMNILSIKFWNLCSCCRVR